MSEHFGIPGVGGSLGMCAVCGQSFALDILKGNACQPFTVGNVDVTMYAHNPKCVTELKNALDTDGTIVPDKLPEGPLRRALTPVQVLDM